MKRYILIFAGLALTFVGIAQAAEPTGTGVQIQALQAQITELEAKQARFEASQNQDWLNDRRAEEVKALIREVLADAETRASLLESHMLAGHNGNHFFLQSSDGGFLMEISGQIQLRYNWNSRDGVRESIRAAVADDGSEFGMEARRTKIQFAGHIADPRIQYALQLSVNSANNAVTADKIVVGYQLTDSIFIAGGEDKGPFLREETTSSAHQLAAERSYVSEFFTLDKVQGVFLTWHDPDVMNDMFQGRLSINDGLRSGDGGTTVNPMTQLDDFLAQDAATMGDRATDKTFDDDATDFAVTARLDARLAGDWAQMDDFTSWSGEDMGLFLGGAIHWENGETGDAFNNNDFFMWTVDSSVEYNGWSLFGAVTGMHTDNNGIDGGTTRDFDLFGFVVQGAYNIDMGDNSLEPFVRYEHIDFDNSVTDAGINTEDDVAIITFGANYYLDRHNAKFTLDVVWALDPVPFGQGGQALIADVTDEDSQVALRAQFQLLF